MKMSSPLHGIGCTQCVLVKETFPLETESTSIASIIINKYLLNKITGNFARYLKMHKHP